MSSWHMFHRDMLEVTLWLYMMCLAIRFILV